MQHYFSSSTCFCIYIIVPCAFQWGKMCTFPGPNYFVQTPEKNLFCTLSVLSGWPFVFEKGWSDKKILVMIQLIGWSDRHFFLQIICITFTEDSQIKKIC